MSLAYNVHTSVNLGYNFPCIDESDIEFASNLPRDVLLNRNLKLEDIPHPKEPHYSKTPISKCYNTKQYSENPLFELLAENQKFMSHYQLELPFTRSNTQNSTSCFKGKQNVEMDSLTRGTKRPRRTNDNIYEHNDIQTQPSYLYKTPIPNKTIYFSSSASSKKKNSTNLLQSTPVSDTGETSNKKSNLLFAKLKILKMDKAELLNLPIKSPAETKTTIRPDDNEEEESMEMASDYDHLACHAGNIMRMAVDSTMLGSSYNDSFSSTFNNTFGGNDSILGLQSRKRYNDFVDDEADKSLIESMKSRWNSGLNRMKAKKIDINADELKQAVQAD